MHVPDELKVHARTTFVPCVQAGDSSRLASKFSGQPWLAEGEAYPACANCAKPLRLFLQLNLDEAPESMRARHGRGLVQLFYCATECENECEAFFPFAKSVVVRRVQPDGLAHPMASAIFAEEIPAVTIKGWEEYEDLPNWEEMEQLGIKHEGLDDDEMMEHFPVRGDKLSGYPGWVQGVEYPSCPECKAEMQLLFQIESQDNLDYMFGDMGCGHITQCLEHPHQLAFGWACT